MYALSIILLLLVFPVASIVTETFAFPGGDPMWLVGKWFTFWGCGVRLFMAGIRQTLQPSFTAEAIFKVTDTRALPIVREIGFGNLSMGTLGLVSLAMPTCLVPAALVGGLYYGLAGLGHVLNKERNAKEQLALVSDLMIFVLLAIFVIDRLAR